jgi:hypothetical protein
MYVYTEIIHENTEMSDLNTCCKYTYRLSTHLPLYQRAHQHQYALREGANKKNHKIKLKNNIKTNFSKRQFLI